MAHAAATKAEPELGGKSSDEEAPEAFGSNAIATLELNNVQAEVIMSAVQSGKLSLVLRASAIWPRRRGVMRLPRPGGAQLGHPHDQPVLDPLTGEVGFGSAGPRR